ncbi:MAG: MFS transporter [Desulfobacterales bacterium]|nr:MFS transporter [Desulfobacterales bacterium]
MSGSNAQTSPAEPNTIMTYFSSVPVRITLFVTGTLLGALFLNMALSILTLEKIYTKSLLSEYSVIGRYHIRKIERSLGFGKTLPKFTGMPKLIKAFHKKNPEITEIFIYSATKELLFRLKEEAKQTNSIIHGEAVREKETVSLKDGNYHLVFPIKGGSRFKRTFQGYAEIVLPETLIKDKISAMIASNGKLLAVVGCISALVFFLIVLLVIPTKKKQSKFYGISLKARALIITSLVLILSQVAFSYFNLKDFRGRYFNEIQSKCETLGSLIKTDVDYLLRLGIPINKLIKIDNLLDEVLQSIPALSDIAIVDTTGEPLYRVVAEDEKIRNEIHELVSDPENSGNRADRIVLPVSRKGTATGYVHLNISTAVIDSTIHDLALDSATVVVVSLLVGFEFVFFLVAILIVGDRSAPRSDETIVDFNPGQKTRVPVRASIRTSAFLYAFAMALSMSFLPIYANALYEPIAGLSREIIIGLPISAEMLCVAISLVLSGYWLDRQGWFFPFITGVIITGVGMALCGIAETTMELITYRGCVGFGYGLALMATQSVVVNLTSLQNRSSAVASLEAGYFSGFISSTAVGGMLAEKIGYRGVFFVGSALVLMAIFFVMAFLMQTRHSGKQPAKTAVKSEKQTGVAALFTDRVFMGSLLLSAIPSALCLVGFLYFASPLLLAELGVKQSNIARLMMPYGLCMVYVAPMISRWVDGINNKRIPVVLGGFLGGLALLSFLFLNSVTLFVVVLILFALSGGLSYGARISTISESPAVKAVGSGKALGVFNSFERIGNTAGPIAVGGMITTFGLSAAISNLGIIYLLGTILFFVVARKTATR